MPIVFVFTYRANIERNTKKWSELWSKRCVDRLTWRWGELQKCESPISQIQILRREVVVTGTGAEPELVRKPHKPTRFWPIATVGGAENLVSCLEMGGIGWKSRLVIREWEWIHGKNFEESLKVFTSYYHFFESRFKSSRLFPFGDTS